MDRLEIKAALAVTDAGEITGNAWPFDEPDAVGDIIRKGAINVAVTDMPMLYGHNPNDLIGTWNETKQTDAGMIVKGQLHMDQPRARSVLAMLKGNLVSGLSMGFRTKLERKQGRNRIIDALDLFEISVVRNPSHPRARVTSAKSLDEAAALAAVINRAAAALTQG